jgi:hypothetical protein
LFESFDERWILAFDLLEHEPLDVAPVDDPPSGIRAIASPPYCSG